MLFIRSLVKYLTLQLTNIGPRECLTDMPEYRLAVETRKLLESFGEFYTFTCSLFGEFFSVYLVGVFTCSLFGEFSLFTCAT